MHVARVAKLADALDLGSCALNGVGVQLPPLAIFIRGTGVQPVIWNLAIGKHEFAGVFHVASRYKNAVPEG